MTSISKYIWSVPESTAAENHYMVFVVHFNTKISVRYELIISVFFYFIHQDYYILLTPMKYNKFLQMTINDYELLLMT